MIHAGPEVLDRLERSTVLWMTTVTADGRPQTSPVWFLWQDGRIVVYSLADSPRVRNLRLNPWVAMNLDGDGRGGAIVTMEESAVLDDAGPTSAEVPAYQAKYLPLITQNEWTADSFANDYPRRIVITPTKLRAY